MVSISSDGWWHPDDSPFEDLADGGIVSGPFPMASEATGAAAILSEVPLGFRGTHVCKLINDTASRHFGYRLETHMKVADDPLICALSDTEAEALGRRVAPGPGGVVSVWWGQVLEHRAIDEARLFDEESRETWKQMVDVFDFKRHGSVNLEDIRSIDVKVLRDRDARREFVFLRSRAVRTLPMSRVTDLTLPASRYR